MFKNNIKLI